MRRFVRFSAVGVLNTVLAYLTFLALVLWARSDPSTAHAAGWIVGFINSYALNRRFTFADRPVLPGSALVKFLVVNLVVLGLSTASVAVLSRAAATSAVGLGASSEAGYAVLEILVLVPALLLNFFLADRWAFRPQAKARAASRSPRT